MPFSFLFRQDGCGVSDTGEVGKALPPSALIALSLFLCSIFSVHLIVDIICQGSLLYIHVEKTSRKS